jgi:3-phosphoshikimate 1-carboxyvinyltransferase
MDVKLVAPHSLRGTVHLPMSKSVCNRLQIIKALAQSPIELPIAESTDALILSQALASNDLVCNVNDAGTAYRFLTAFFACNPNGGTKILTGSPRLRERPITQLVGALQSIGADISYAGTTNCAPLRIVGNKLQGGVVQVDASISSQFLSALCLIAPYCSEGLHLQFASEPTSVSYIDMTLDMMSKHGAQVQRSPNSIIIAPTAYTPVQFSAELDWSAASFFLCALLLKPGDITFHTLYKDTTQGDAALLAVLEGCGISAHYSSVGLQVTSNVIQQPITQFTDFSSMPDAAVPFIVASSVADQGFSIAGLHTLPLKECNRIEALQTELSKVGIALNYAHGAMQVKQGMLQLNQGITFSSHHDHRIAMSLAMLSLRLPWVEITDADCVAKSYPLFWKTLESLGWQVQHSH